MHLRSFSDFQSRAQALVQALNIHLDTVISSFKDDVTQVHCENLIGATTVPLGVAGPITIAGDDRIHYIPMATTEGALVASVSRGAKVISSAGGATTSVERVGVSRGSVFDVKGIIQGQELCEWLLNYKESIAEVAHRTSSHITLVHIQTYAVGTRVFARFVYDTDQAMGMNMVTIATDVVARYIEKEKNIRCIAVAGNFDIDKKPAWSTFSEGRGWKVQAEVTVPAMMVKEMLNTDPVSIVEVVQAKCWEGSMVSGALGFNAHFANIAAAFYIATGQDPAHVVEASHGITSAHITERGDLYFSITAPAIMMGTVGGGTGLRTQKEARSLCNVASTRELVSLCSAALLAGELSLIASIATGTLASSHQALGRSHK